MFYRKSRPRADGTVGYSAYDHADTIAEGIDAYKRCRTQKTFILTDNSPDHATTNCVGCGKRLADIDGIAQGYRATYVDYYPRTKSARPYHYVCAWQKTLNDINKIRSRI